MSSWPPRWLTPVDESAIAKSRSPQIQAFFDHYAMQTKDTIAGRSGEPLVLRDWQRQLLDRLFAVGENGKLLHRTALLGLPRKNGKSALGSGIALWSLFLGDDGGEIYSCAADKEQARIVFGDAKRMIEASPELFGASRLYRDAIEVPSTGSIYRVLSSEAFTKQGLSPTLVVMDELHAQPNPELYNVMNLGMGARREPLMLSITTAGVRTDQTGRDSTAYQAYQYGKRVASGEVDDPTFFMAWWEADPEAPHYERKTWIDANPGFGDLNDEADFVSMVKRIPEADFRTYRCNQWVNSQYSWLPTGAWDKLAEPKDLDPEKEYILGFDGSFNGDCTVIVGCEVPEDNEQSPYVFLYKIWEKQETDRDDWRVDTLEVENAILDFTAQYPKVREIACDPYRWQRTMDVLLEKGLPIVNWPTTSARRMVPACAKFYDAVVEKTLTHDGSPALARHLNNAVLKIDNIGPRIVKESKNSSRKIDAAVGAIIALDRALSVGKLEEVEPPRFFI